MSETIGSSGFGISIAPPHSSGQKTVIDGFFFGSRKISFFIPDWKAS